MESRIQFNRDNPRRRGIAMILLLIALTVSSVLAMSFLTAQSTSIGMSQNLQKQLNARTIAETALGLGVQAINSDPSWRADYTNGVWINNQSYGGGAYTLKVEDGLYNATSNAVVGDGSLINNPMDTVTVTASATYGGVAYTVRAAVETSMDTAPAPTGVCADDSITLGTSTYVDAFDSGAGAYGGGNIILNKATVSTNSTGSAKLALSGSAKINGSVSVGPGGATGTVISTSGSATITGSKSVLASKVLMTLPTNPAGMPASSGSLTVSSGTTTLNTNAHYSSITVNGTGILNINGNVAVLVDGNVQVSGAGQVTLGANSGLKLYISGGLQISNTAQVNVNVADPTRLQVFMLAANQNVTMDTSARLYAEVLAPQGNVVLANSAQIYGTILCTQLQADATTAIHVDIGTGHGTSTVDFGNKTIFSTSTKKVNGKQVATQVAFTQAGTLQSISAYVKGSAAKLVRYALYTDSAGSPGSLVVQTANVKVGSNTLHWLTIPTPATTVAAGTYWVALGLQASGMCYQDNATGGQTRYKTNNATTYGFLSSWGSSTTTLTQSVDIYATVLPTGSGSSISPPTLPVYSYDTDWGEQP